MSLRKRLLEQSIWLFTLVAFAAWPAYCVWHGEYRWEFLGFFFLGVVLPHLGPRARRLFFGILPLGILGFVYDVMRFVRNVGLSADRVHVCDVRELEIRWFGIHAAGGPTTVHEYLQAHASLPLDVLCAIPYGTFLEAALALVVVLYFLDYRAMQRFGWSILAVNVAGFVTHHFYPAAAPWYYHAHGCVVDLAARASAGPNLARVDAWLGVSYFRGFYERSTDVYGAIPSLHVAYPLLMILESWRPFGRLSPVPRWSCRVGLIVFFLLMCFGAVYLDHHWIIDVVAGIVYGLVVFAAFRVGAFLLLSRSATARNGEVHPGRTAAA